MYTGEVTVARDQLPMLYETASTLKIPGIIKDYLILVYKLHPNENTWTIPPI